MTQTSLTRCPQCQTIFRLTATQLKKAKGKVRCGSCAHVFDARNYLLDTPAPSATTPPPPKTSTATKTNKTSPTTSSIQNDEFFDLAAKPAAAAPVTPPPRTPPAKQNQFIDSIVDDRSRYNNLDKIGNIPIPGEIHDGMQSINRPKESMPTPKPPAAEPPAPPATAAASKPVSKPAAKSAAKKNPYEDLESKDKPTSIDDLEGINALYEIASSQVDQTPSLPEAEEIVISGPAKKTKPTDPFDLENFTDNSFTTDIEAPAIEEPKPTPAPSRKKTFFGNRNAEPEPVMPFSLRTSMNEVEEEPRPPWMTSSLVFVALILVVVMGFQAALFRSVQLAETFPRLIPPLYWFCSHLPCRYSGERDVDQIELVNRDVRSHPTAKNALQITVTIVNQAKFRQPYPDMLLTMSNLSGQVIARRRFTPQEYLDKLYSPFLRMEPETPVHITLSVIDPGEDAINFEFSFQ